MRILFIGDIVGRPGRDCTKKILGDLKKELEIDVVIANGENAAGGAGTTEKVCHELKVAGIDVITGGNHTWDQRDIYNFIDNESSLLRPANYPEVDTPGKGFVVKLSGGRAIKYAVINLIGRVFMGPSECPFRKADYLIEKLRLETPVILVDFHAEATSEKQAMGWYLSGRVSAVIGTHSHVQTADSKILDKATAYITDVGMTGLYDSVLGVDKEGPLDRFLTLRPKRFEIGRGDVLFNAVVVDLNDFDGRAKSIEPIYRIYGESGIE